MLIRDFRQEDRVGVEGILVLYWNDKDFRGKVLDRLDSYIKHDEEWSSKQYRFYVADEKGEIVGIAGFRKAPDHMIQYATTENPAEFYILGSKYKGRGIGEALRLKRLKEAKELGFTEVILYSPDSHKDSWGFHDRLGFERVGSAFAPDGEPGMIWRKVF